MEGRCLKIVCNNTADAAMSGEVTTLVYPVRLLGDTPRIMSVHTMARFWNNGRVRVR